jgi:hypothetical protein
VTILEVARTLNKLINEGKVARPARTIRFIWPPEVEGTMALLNGRGFFGSEEVERGPNGEGTHNVGDGIVQGSKMAKRIKAVVHMDMVGGGPATKAVFHVTRGPMSLPSFVHDVAWAFADWLNDQSYRFAAGLRAEYPMVAPEGGKEPLRAEYTAYTMGSDHDVYQDSSFGIPAIYMNDWPDRYIHTNFDTAANIDPTKLKRAAFIGAASAYVLATMAKDTAEAVKLRIDEQRGIARERAAYRNRFFSSDDQFSFRAWRVLYDVEVLRSFSKFALGSVTDSEIKQIAIVPLTPFHKDAQDIKRPTGDGLLKFRRTESPKGPLAVFGYDYFGEHAKAAGIAEPKLLSYEGLWGGGEEYAYEVLNFADGKRNAQEIRDAVSAEYGPVPLELVVEYLRALEKIGVVAEVK